MPTIVVSKKDPVAVRIGELLLEKFSESGKVFRGRPVYEYKDMEMIVIDGLHLYADYLSEEYPSDLFVFPSVHRSEKEIPCITVHPVGNFGDSMYGGKARELSPAPAQYMLKALKVLSKNCPEGLRVSYEVTHHGPFLTNPAFFMEIGSTEREWRDDGALKCIFRAIMGLKKEEAPVAVGVGGGHYAPRFTETALKKNLAFGHMAPKYASLNGEMVAKIVEKTVPRPEYYVVHGEASDTVIEELEALGLKAFYH